MDDFQLGLVSVLYNSDELLKDFFHSISIQNFTNFAIYLIDNNSNDKTTELIKQYEIQYKFQLKYIPLNNNVGVAEANNVGIVQAIKDSCSAIILLNNDISFDNPNLFSAIIQTAIQKKQKIVAPKIYYSGTNKIWFGGGFISLLKGGVIHFAYRKTDYDGLLHSGITGYAPTTFMYVDKNVFEKVGLLDSTYFLYAEDLDFVYRAQKEGFHIWYENDYFLYHHVGFTTGGVFSPLNIYYNTRNRLYFARKYLSWFYKVPAVTFILTSMLFHACRQRTRIAIMSYLRAINHGFKLFINSSGRNAGI